MYLVPKKVYDKFINGVSNGTRETVNQINNLDVQSGARVTISNDCKEGSTTITPGLDETTDPSSPKELSPEEPSPEEPPPEQPNEPFPEEPTGENPFTYNFESNKPPDVFSSKSTDTSNLGAINIVPNKQSESTTQDENNDSKTIYVLDEKGVKFPKAVKSAKLNALDWLDSDSTPNKDIFLDSRALQMKRGNRKRFNRRYVSAPFVLKRNLTPSIAKELIKDKSALIQTKSNGNQPIPDKQLNFEPAQPDTSQEKKPFRVKIDEIGDDDVPMIEDLTYSRLKRKRRTAEENIGQPSGKEVKNPINARKRSRPVRKVNLKKLKFDWSTD